jgi:aminomethyltransferase
MKAVPTGDLAHQVAAVRERVALGLREDLCLLAMDARAGMDALDGHVATNLDIREAQLRQGLVLDEAGRPRLDLLLGFFRGRMWALATGLPEEEAVAALGAHGAERLGAEHVVFTVDGPFAWEVLARWDTAAAVGLPYLGCYAPREGLLVIREGRTGEYGYLVIAPRAEAPAVWEALRAAAAPMDPAVIGPEARAHCALENWVFDLPHDGAHGLDALELQLTWRLDLRKQAPGLDAIRAHRAAGLRRRITALSTSAPVSPGDPVRAGAQAIGRVLRVAPDLSGAGHRVVAALDLPWAAAGMTYAIGEQPATTRSAPFVLNRSLFVNPQRHAWAARGEIELPAGATWSIPTSS